MRDEIIEFAYKLYLCDVITLQEYNQVVEAVVNDCLGDFEQLIKE